MTKEEEIEIYGLTFKGYLALLFISEPPQSFEAQEIRINELMKEPHFVAAVLDWLVKEKMVDVGALQ